MRSFRIIYVYLTAFIGLLVSCDQWFHSVKERQQTETGYTNVSNRSQQQLSPFRNLGCESVPTAGLSLETYKPRSIYGEVYQDLVEEILKTLREEQRSLKVSLATTPQSPGNLSLLLAASRVSEEKLQAHQQLKTRFDERVRDIVARLFNTDKLYFVHLIGDFMKDAPPDQQREVAKEMEILATLYSQDLSKADASRAAVQHTTEFWPEGKIYYRFSPEDQQALSPAHFQRLSEQVRWAMRVWEEQTDGAVQFIEGQQPRLVSAVAGFLYGPRYQLTVRFNDRESSALGHAYLGYHHRSDHHYMWMSPFIASEEDIKGETSRLGAKLALAASLDNARMVALHELGHVLGLEHEHARFDRNNYIKDNFDGYDPRNEPTTYHYGWKQVRQGPYVFSLPYRKYCPEATEQRYSDYDYFSVMHYMSGVVLKEQTETVEVKGADDIYREVTTTVHPGDDIGKLRIGIGHLDNGVQTEIGHRAFLSPRDIAAVKFMYSGDF